MIVQVETVSFNSYPEDYIESFPIREAVSQYELQGETKEKGVKFVKTDRLDALIDDIGTDCIVTNPESNARKYDDARWIVRVYDGYNE